MSIPGGVPEQGVQTWEHSWKGEDVIIEFPVSLTWGPIFFSRADAPEYWDSLCDPEPNVIVEGGK